VYCSDTAPFTDLLLGHEFVMKPPSLDEPLPPDTAAELAKLRAGVVALAQGADLLIYDTQFTYDEYRLRPHWGHSHPDDAIAVARDAKVKRLCLFHHAPLRSDDDNDAILAKYRAVVTQSGDPFDVISAYEGLELALGDQ
jgi:L-ascorbate metabolism protein UlaG (beta-lactamase superfamily)